jgi:outer membrane immunogenic protein
LEFDIMKLLVLAAALALSATSASAADLAARPYTKAPPMAPITTWAGFYAGLNAGYGWARDDHQNLTPGGGYFSDFTTGPAFPNTQRIKPDGAVYGGQFGYNWQSANWVFGLEGQFNGADLKRTDDSIYFPGITALRAKLDAFGTATGRVGYAFGDVLPYVKAGYAAARFNTTDFDTTNPTTLSHRDWRSGYTVGAGVEWMFVPNWSVAAEYNYMNFGNRDFSGSFINFIPPGGAVLTSTYRDKLEFSTVTVRLNYHFGGPVVAKY